MTLNKKGFTLIELMVVIVIIGVLASLAIPRFSQVSARSKAAEGPRLLSMFESAQLTALADNGTLLTTKALLGAAIGGFDAKSEWWTSGEFTGNASAITFSLNSKGIGGGVADGAILDIMVTSDGVVTYPTKTACASTHKLEALIKAHCAKVR